MHFFGHPYCSISTKLCLDSALKGASVFRCFEKKTPAFNISIWQRLLKNDSNGKGKEILTTKSGGGGLVLY